MDLGTATHFSQGWDSALIPAIERVEADHVRDAIYWSAVERVPGVYVYEGLRRDFPVRIAGTGTEVRLLFRATHPDVENGHTVQSEAGLAAFADFVVATVARFPQVDTIEIGNEFNGTFVVGPLKAAGPVDRAKAHARIVAAVAQRLRETAPHVRILGGAAHSIPLVYLEALAEAGLLSDIDALVVHPYSSPPAHVGEHLEIARRALDRPELAIHATEFGQETDDPVMAANHLVQMATALAAAGVESATWYALAEQSQYPGMGLVERDGTDRPAASAFRLMQRLLAFGTPYQIDLGPGIRAYDFAGRALVVWGIERAVTQSGDLAWTDATGTPVAAPALSPGAPLVAFAPEPVRFEDVVQLAETGIVDDSYYGFGFAPGTPWRRLARARSGREVELTMQGGGARGTAWRPYMGDAWLNPLSVSERFVVPAVFSNPKGPVAYDVIEEVDLAALSAQAICAQFQHGGSSGDGVSVRLTVDGVKVRQGALAPGEVLSWRVETTSASKVAVTIDPGENASGDRIARHHVLLSDARFPCPAPVMPE